MKEGIHPAYEETTITCACGNVIEANSTIKGDTYQIETCSACHPFYTKKQATTSKKGRVEKFNKKYGLQ